LADRLPAHVEAAALVRQAESEGGFGAIVKRGDPDRGALVILVAHRGNHRACLERTLGPTGNYGWQTVGPPAGAEPSALADWSQKRVRFDEDLWLIELDVPHPERFIAETTAHG
jgi:hypothetical protein